MQFSQILRPAVLTLVLAPALAWLAATRSARCSAAIRAATTRKPQYVERPVDQIYDDAWKQINDGDWDGAAKQFDEVERQHPYSVWARRAMLMSAYCYYQANKYPDAIAAADSYISLHPGSHEVAYAFYLKAISLYEQIVDVGRDQSNTEARWPRCRTWCSAFPTPNMPATRR